MKLSHKWKKRLSILALVVWMPLYIVVVVELVQLFDRPPFLLELGLYVGLGILWILPLKSIFKGVGRAAPEDEQT